MDVFVCELFIWMPLVEVVTSVFVELVYLPKGEVKPPALAWELATRGRASKKNGGTL